MSRLDEIRAVIAKDWPDDPVVDVCERIIGFLVKLPEEELRQLSPTAFSRGVGRDEVDELLLKAITILTATSVKILEPHFLFIDDEDQEYEVSRESLRYAQREGTLVHPKTGSEIEDYESHILPYFSPTDEFIRLKSAVG